MMAWSRAVLAWSVLMATVLTTQCCMLTEYTHKTTYQLLEMADVVVHGRDIDHVVRTNVNLTGGRLTNVTDCTFQVYCVLKGNITMGNITIEHIHPLTDCSGTIGKLQVGMEMIVALGMTAQGGYKYDEGNALQSSVFESSPDNFRTMNNVTMSTKWKTPSNVTENTCDYAIKSATITINATTTNSNKVTNASITTIAQTVEASNASIAITAQTVEATNESSTTTIQTVTATSTTTKTTATETTTAEFKVKIGANLEYTQDVDNSAVSTAVLPHVFTMTVVALVVLY